LNHCRFEKLRGHRITRLAVLDFGCFEVRNGERVIGIPGFLLQTDRGAWVLVDTGFPPAYATDPGIAERDGLPGFGCLLNHGLQHTLAGQLALFRLTPKDISLTVLSHGHIDHVGGLPDVVHAPIVLTQRERAEPRPSYFGTARPMPWPVAEYIEITETTQLCEGLILIPTPGHTPGHLSLHVTLPENGAMILAADAINRASEPDEGFADAVDPDAARQSAELLMLLREETKGWLIFGHDPAQWPELRKAPYLYT
jgi:N-acyl homoserine lactone hydrolase